MSHLNFPGKIIFQIFRKIQGLWLVKSPVKVLSQKNGGRICQAWIKSEPWNRVCTWENEHEIHWNSVCFYFNDLVYWIQSLFWTLNHFIKFHSQLLHSTIGFHIDITWIHVALRSGCEEATTVSCLEVLKNLLTDLAYFTWSSVYQYLPSIAPCENGSCTMFFWCWCIQDSHKNMEYPGSLGCIPAQQEDTYRMMYHLPGCQSRPLTNVDPCWSQSSTGILHMSLWIYFVICNKNVYI